jgi:secreted trypsin-like serine protease
VPSAVNSDRDLESARIVGGNQADNGEYPYFGESVQSPRRLKCGFAFISSQITESGRRKSRLEMS